MTDQLFDRLTRAAMGMLEVLESDDQKDAKGNPKEASYTLEQKMRAFTMCQAWLKELLRLRPPEDDMSPGVEYLKQLMQRPDVAQTLENAGFVKIPDRNGGRDNAINRTRRARVKKVRAVIQEIAAEQDDSGLKKILAKQVRPNGSAQKKQLSPDQLALLARGRAKLEENRAATRDAKAARENME